MRFELPRRKFLGEQREKLTLFSKLAPSTIRNEDMYVVFIHNKSMIEPLKRYVKNKGYPRIELFKLSQKKWVLIGRKNKGKDRRK
jgi:hypothetical protein